MLPKNYYAPLSRFIVLVTESLEAVCNKLDQVATMLTTMTGEESRRCMRGSLARCENGAHARAWRLDTVACRIGVRFSAHIRVSARGPRCSSWQAFYLSLILWKPHQKYSGIRNGLPLFFQSGNSPRTDFLQLLAGVLPEVTPLSPRSPRKLNSPPSPSNRQDVEPHIPKHDAAASLWLRLVPARVVAHRQARSARIYQQ